ncbi:hypothetical protein HdH2rev_00099 [Escherichia phage vB_EcoS_HdH2]|uniref:Uncharacterized protein n=1 Tax=Escherichia phage vB_EcoS_HdH2 TaxID=2508174 RepID=A0A482N613_9CAUD|nr:hypothetical protein HWC04_gp160 [Escherichia phage vB_EcoS_HdH2]QBQ81174.1 hypothetical protein HdH2rev_00099 [Escherichia phage vB_EcoS_HdH2]
MSKYGFVNNGLNQSMGSQQPIPGLDNPYLQQLQQRLAEAQQMQQQLQQNPGSVSPMQMMQQMSGQSQMPQQMQQQMPQQQQVQQQTHQPQVSAEGQAVLALFEDFAKTEDGKQLVSLMGKFNSFCQSQIAKAQNSGDNS